MSPTPKNLILDLLCTLRKGAMPVRALIAAGELFGLAGGSVRVALARLRAEGLVERDERGQYRLGPRARTMSEQIRSWRNPEGRLGPWSGAWIGVFTAGLARGSPRGRRRRARALEFLGFRSLEPGLELRPDNLRGGVAEVRRRLRGLGLEAGAPVFRIEALDGEREARVWGLWDDAELCERYERSRAELAASSRRLPRLPTEEAMVESFLLGGRVIRQIVFDPLLPEPLVPAAARQRLVAAMGRYDRLGRACWAEFLRRFDVPHLRTPVDVRVAETTAELGAATGGGG